MAMSGSYRDNMTKADLQDYQELLFEYTKLINAIVRQRKKLKLSQQDLADKCCMSCSSIHKIETMKMVPRLDALINIMNHLELHLRVMPNNMPRF